MTIVGSVTYIHDPLGRVDVEIENVSHRERPISLRVVDTEDKSEVGAWASIEEVKRIRKNLKRAIKYAEANAR